MGYMIEDDIRRFLVRGTGNQVPNNTSLYDDLTWQQQDDATISQNNPVSTTKYAVLATTTNVRLISIMAQTTGGTVSALTVTVTIDGKTATFTKSLPISGTAYLCYLDGTVALSAQTMGTTHDQTVFQPLLEGRSVKVEVAVTWTVQPSPLVGLVRYATR
jgi:hypothetical protein